MGVWCLGLSRKKLYTDDRFYKAGILSYVISAYPSYLSAPRRVLNLWQRHGLSAYSTLSIFTFGLCMYELHLCVSLFVLLSLLTSDRSSLSVPYSRTSLVLILYWLNQTTHSPSFDIHFGSLYTSTPLQLWIC